LKFPSPNYPVWVEITKNESGHGGLGWEFGTCLWSPSKDRRGYDYYATMRILEPNDTVLHFYNDKWPDGKRDTRFCAISEVAKKFSEISDTPPSPGRWDNMSPYYRIDLKNFQSLLAPVPLKTISNIYASEIRRDIFKNKPKYYPFVKFGDGVRTAQGRYLGTATPVLCEILQDAAGIESSKEPKEAKKSKTPQKVSRTNHHEEYAEGQRKLRETYFFARNPKLVKEAKEHYGYTWQICGFNFEEKYGSLGIEYIECHHLIPLSERAEEEWEGDNLTNISQVTVLCSNCHRMVHRKKPALGLDKVKKSMSQD
jgi:5-methylcytosine-specific restriction endonuclease McrA